MVMTKQAPSLPCLAFETRKVGKIFFDKDIFVHCSQIVFPKLLHRKCVFVFWHCILLFQYIARNHPPPRSKWEGNVLCAEIAQAFLPSVCLAGELICPTIFSDDLCVAVTQAFQTLSVPTSMFAMSCELNQP